MDIVHMYEVSRRMIFMQAITEQLAFRRLNRWNRLRPDSANRPFAQTPAPAETRRRSCSSSVNRSIL